jgi:glycosyltransferase involved in cell wall biosynthesis
MTKLLVVINSLEKGGAERLLVSSLPVLKKLNIDIEVLLLNAGNSVPSFISLLEESAIVIHDLKLSNIYNPIAILKIKRFLSNYKYDIVHVHLFPSLYWVSLASWFLNSKPILIYTEHSTSNKRRQYGYLRLLERVIYKNYEKIIAITDKVRENLSIWLKNNENIVVIHNGVDISNIDRSKKIDREAICFELGIPKESLLILMTAAFRTPKDQISVVKACQIWGSNYHLLFAGDGELRKATDESVKRLNLSTRIHFLGFRSDTYSLMKSVDLNILSSNYEGMSGVTLESLASGIPFLGSNVDGIRELVPNSGFLFDKGSSTDIAKKVGAILSDPALYHTMSIQGISQAAKYSLDAMADTYCALYESLHPTKSKNN